MKINFRILQLVMSSILLISTTALLKAQNACFDNCVNLCRALAPLMLPIDQYGTGIQKNTLPLLKLMGSNCSTTSQCQQAVSTLSQNLSSYPLTNYDSAAKAYLNLCGYGSNAYVISCRKMCGITPGETSNQVRESTTIKKPNPIQRKNAIK